MRIGSNIGTKEDYRGSERVDYWKHRKKVNKEKRNYWVISNGT